MTRNEVLQKLKLLMEQSLSHGAPDPKLSKMLEVLTDHFSMWQFPLSLSALYYWQYIFKVSFVILTHPEANRCDIQNS